MIFPYRVRQMGAIVDLVSFTTRLIESTKNRRFAAELREIQRMIASLQSEHASIHESRIALMTENAELKQKIATLELLVAEKTALQNTAQDQEFVEHRGVLLKRRPDGGFHDAAYCPSCKLPMGFIERNGPMRCGRCNTRSPFEAWELPAMIIEFEKQKGP